MICYDEFVNQWLINSHTLQKCESASLYHCFAIPTS